MSSFWEETTMSNITMVQSGIEILHPILSRYVAQEIQSNFKDNWWNQVSLYLRESTREYPKEGSIDKLIASLDMETCLFLFDRAWNDVFRKKLSVDYRTWAKELVGVVEKLNHNTDISFSIDDTWRALDTMARICDALDDDGAESIRALQRKTRYGSEDGSTSINESPSSISSDKSKHESVMSEIMPSGLPSWRDIIEPHQDVAQGRYKNAEFAADLSQVSRGEGAFEYRDPVEFFARTYVTEGMKSLLVQALKRVNGKDGEPVIQLKTAFGGGKTHSMLALYHMMRGKVTIDKIPNVKPVLAEAGVNALPKANVAVLVGTALDPTKTKRPNNFPGITVSTLWGEIAYQLAISAGRPELYNYVKEADKKGVSPGSDALRELFDDCGPCLVLMDETVAYAKKLYDVSGLPAGSFDNLITFIQEITEAASASKNSLVVASIPESDLEIGGDAGKAALEAIEHTFGRMESIWKPVNADEGYEVVRRRLFLDCKNEELREKVCARFSQMYSENAGDFPLETKEVEYKERMISCYPIHPEVFDRLYNDWATLERFQRTRGVLRLMAGVIHELWMGNDSSAMIMPGSIPMDVSSIRDELTRHLNESWNAIVDREIDGKNSIPYQKDKNIPRFGRKMACRRVARTIMLGSAPTSRSQSVRGIEASRIRLGSIQPGENISDFNDALNTLQVSLAYLYTNPSGDRLWYDTRPTLRKTVEDRMTQIASADVEFEIERRLRSLRRESPFDGLHICPTSSLDVPDEENVRLVILRPIDTYKASSDNNKALTIAENLLNNRGSSARVFRNTLAFVAPDSDMMNSLLQESRRYLAWKSVRDDSEDLNLDAAQNHETENSLRRSNDTVELRIKEAYCWLIVPYIDVNSDIKTVQWDKIRISGGTDTIVAKAAKKMIQNEALITKWAPSLLLMELNNLLWKDSDDIKIKVLWDYLCTYCYLPRLANANVLFDAIKAGVSSSEYFAIASGKDNGRYMDLRINQSIYEVNMPDYLVKISVADKQLSEEQRIVEETAKNEGNHVNETYQTGSGDNNSTPKIAEQNDTKKTKFYMSAKLDNIRINHDVQNLVQEVISHLQNDDGCDLELTLEVNASKAEGFTQPVIRTVTENCQTLHVQSFGFEE